MDGQLKTLIDLQGVDTRIAALEAEAARLPREIAAVHAAVQALKQDVDAGKTRFDVAKKDQRVREKDLESVQAKRSKTEGRLYEVKTNKEYSAVLAEVERHDVVWHKVAGHSGHEMNDRADALARSAIPPR
ncbi:MAG: RNase H family protein [Candidatus Rokubacteria bacterium]|nr:RNase H family protein [Candidatus Rokubacteria bacterium]